jgi:hypothetical protein
MRRAARKDENQDRIVKALRAVGVKVEILNQDDIPDLLVGFRFNLWLFEVKDGDKSPSRRKLRPGQQRFADRWAGYPIVKVETISDAFRALGIEVQG